MAASVCLDKKNTTAFEEIYQTLAKIHHRLKHKIMSQKAESPVKENLADLK